MPKAKDHGYFCWRSGPHVMAREKYEQLFLRAGDRPRVGEATAAYFWTQSAPEPHQYPEGYEADIPARVRETLGDSIKLLLLLRNPVERAVSAYLHHVSHGTLTFDTPLLEAGPELGLVDIGYYSRHLERWQSQFASEQLMILCTEEDLSIKGEATLSKVFEFLDVEPGFSAQGPAVPIYSGRARRWHEGEIWVAEGDTVSSQRWRRVVDLETLRTLRSRYRPDVAALSSLTGRNFGEIWGLR